MSPSFRAPRAGVTTPHPRSPIACSVLVLLLEVRTLARVIAVARLLALLSSFLVLFLGVMDVRDPVSLVFILALGTVLCLLSLLATCKRVLGWRKEFDGWDMSLTVGM